MYQRCKWIPEPRVGHKTRKTAIKIGSEHHREGNALDVKCALEVMPIEVAWLWPRWLPQNKLVIFDGDPGIGKTTVIST